jgi:hypothetical protein
MSGGNASSGSSDASSGSSDASNAPDAECVYEYVTGSKVTGTGGHCASSALTNDDTILASGTVETVTDDAGAAEASTSDDASDDSDLDNGTDGGIVPGGGISQIDSKYLYAPDSVTHITVGAETASNVTIKGLLNGVQYNIAIASVDALGNVGPLSNLTCGTPMPVNDFWDDYKAAGGQAGGGFCALEGAGAPAGSAVMVGGLVTALAGMLRRRRTRK